MSNRENGTLLLDIECQARNLFPAVFTKQQKTMGFGQLLGQHTAIGLADTAMNGLGQAIGQLFQRSNMRYQRDMQADLMHLQDRINDENLKDEREYNDPSAVASRARSAGVAPSALLGGAPGGPGVSSTSRVSGLGVSPGSAPSGVGRGNFAGLMHAHNEHELVDSQAYKNRAEGDAALALAGLNKAKEAAQKYYNVYIQPLESAGLELDNENKELSNQISDFSLSVAKAKESHDAKMRPIELEQAKLQIPKIKAEVAKLVSQKKLNDQSAKKMITEMAVNFAQVGYLKESALLAEQQRINSMSEEQRKRELHSLNKQFLGEQIAEKIAKTAYYNKLSDKVTHDIILGYANFGLDAVGEFRNWCKLFFDVSKHNEDKNNIFIDNTGLSSSSVEDVDFEEILGAVEMLGGEDAAMLLAM